MREQQGKVSFESFHADGVQNLQLLLNWMIFFAK